MLTTMGLYPLPQQQECLRGKLLNRWKRIITLVHVHNSRFDPIATTRGSSTKLPSVRGHAHNIWAASTISITGKPTKESTTLSGSTISGQESIILFGCTILGQVSIVVSGSKTMSEHEDAFPQVWSLFIPMAVATTYLADICTMYCPTYSISAEVGTNNTGITMVTG